MSALSAEILFEKFQIIEVLKKDEHAAVFLANHIYLNKKIILKVLNTQKIHDPSLVERFKREAKILAKLDHPNIIKVLDFGLSKEFFYISFEYIEGESLRNVFKTKTLTQEQKEHLMIQLLKGLDYAHANQIIHRDIKPENIFIDKNLNVKLGDFGLALSAEDNYVTNPYSIVGTPSYMSPEQIRGSKLTAQSDLFSLGVVLAELFTGQNPFLKENVSLTLNEINSYDETTLEEKLSGVQENIREILLVLLKKNINQRYESAGEILEELNIQVDQPTIVVNNIDTEGRKSKLAWIFLAAIALVVIGIVVVLIINGQKQNSSQVPFGKDSAQLKNDSAIQNNISNQQKDQTNNPVDLNKLKEPLVDNKDQASTENQKTNPNLNPSNSMGTGSLDIKTFPTNVEVFINGESYDKTPFKRVIPMKTGEFIIKFIHPNYPPFYKTVKVEVDSITKVYVNLETETLGFINCAVYPLVGDIYINGNYKTQVPMKKSDLIKVTPGPITLTIKNSNFQDIDTSFTIKAKDTLRLQFRFRNK
ncbi:MAG: serine/threonine protein kinase [Ignavibacteriales bacterium]|nr:serine/threonine protein kinase [Ignavibacteriales bacterium]